MIRQLFRVSILDVCICIMYDKQNIIITPNIVCAASFIIVVYLTRIYIYLSMSIHMTMV